MKTILCYGDGNTWGCDPKTHERFPRNVRWPGVLKSHLGTGYEVIEEGLPRRTTVLNDPIDGKWKNGKKYLLPCLESHSPIDLVIFMLGTNDAKKRFSLTPTDISNGMETLVKIVKASGMGPRCPGMQGTQPPKILLLSPPPLGPLIQNVDRFEGAENKIKILPVHYEVIAKSHGCEFLDIQKIVSVTDVDNVHLDVEGHKKVGVAVATMVSKIFK